MMHAVDVSPLQIAGGCLLLADMILTTVLFAYWEKAGQMRLRIGKR